MNIIFKSLRFHNPNIFIILYHLVILVSFSFLCKYMFLISFCLDFFHISLLLKMNQTEQYNNENR
jgi:hypothetical protein